MTELSDELLVAYVDGQLVREQTRAVDKVLEHDDVIARRVEALKDAHGRFESAFEAILAGEMIEILAAPMLPPRAKRKRGNGLAKIGIAGRRHRRCARRACRRLWLAACPQSLQCRHDWTGRHDRRARRRRLNRRRARASAQASPSASSLRQDSA